MDLWRVADPDEIRSSGIGGVDIQRFFIGGVRDARVLSLLRWVQEDFEAVDEVGERGSPLGDLLPAIHHHLVPLKRMRKVR